ncbi:MAG TPA: uroporphyrinogen-III C-methyltransferase [Acidisoma sp.]|uniref:uroporphyrinogen-III C-methyltransferase n=1 Tax=Acidisoma sp. TaxID=1872115 RepID=UPI002C65E223|nr:uroporphyrinogen-III C-methyltransferase [Acidisoma sp.]HTI02209.1 uroporphyrinogen-III C-methyltransferase [Acidisoma sp.]
MTIQTDQEAGLSRLMARRPRLDPGHVWLAGAGPGDVGHLTLDAVSAMGQAEVVLHDALVGTEIFSLIRPGAELIHAGKRCGKPSSEQAGISAELVAQARAGRRVLRLKGGDPFVFGRGGEEILALAEAGIPFRVIPGLTAGVAGLAAALIPATMRGINQAIIFATGHGAESQHATLNWEAMAALGQPIVLYMGSKRISTIARRLMAGGMDAAMPAALILGATTARQEVTVTDLAHIAETAAGAEEEAPALIVIGRIVAMRQRISDLVAAVVPELC